MPDGAKISDAHRRRCAVVYVRQSSPGQVAQHLESAARQYALVDRAVELGWQRERVVVVDTDTGRSGSSTDGRDGFKQLAADVGLGEVGLVLSLEVSRLARRSSDWHHLLDLCALTGTLIADQDGVYAPGDYNDRLVLGLKGAMSEAELHLIRARLNGGLRNKAARGELRMALPVGLDRDDDGRIVLAVDEQVRSVIGYVFALYTRLGSARQVVSELVADGVLVPRRSTGQRRVRWARPTYASIHDFLTNPAYAGAFVYGRTREQTTIDADGVVHKRSGEVPIADWLVCLPDHHPGYLSWPDYLANRARLRANVKRRGEGGGAAREGKALLQGLVRCGRCGRRMQVAYSGRAGCTPRYACVRAHQLQGAATSCQTIGGIRLDRAVANAFLEAVTPAGISASTAAIGQLEADHDARLAQQRLAVECAAYHAERAKRQYDACEPEHRLVARTLEQAWEQTLAVADAERFKLASLEHTRPAPLTRQERAALVRLACDLPRLWAAATTTSRDRKELLRTLLYDVIVTVAKAEGHAAVELVWEGGARSQFHLRLNRQGPERTRTSEDTISLVRRLAEHHPDRQIAAVLNKQRRTTGTGLPFTEARVKGIRQRAGIATATPPAKDSGVYTIDQAARELAVSTATIRRWLNAGLLPGEQTTPHAPWRVRLSDDVRRRFLPDVPAGYLPLAEAARTLGVARQTVLHQVQRGDRHAIHVTQGRRKGLRISVSSQDPGLFAQP